MMVLKVTKNQRFTLPVENTFLEEPHRGVKAAEACDFIKKEALAQAFSCEFCEISKNTFSHRTPPVAASDHTQA